MHMTPQTIIGAVRKDGVTTPAFVFDGPSVQSLERMTEEVEEYLRLRDTAGGVAGLLPYGPTLLVFRFDRAESWFAATVQASPDNDNFKAVTYGDQTEMDRFIKAVRFALPSGRPAEAEDVLKRWSTLAIQCLLARLYSPNATTRQITHDAKLQRARAKRGNPPLHDYSVVEIRPPAPKNPAQGGTHASPRLHWRRGHVRRLGGATHTVRPHLVGDRLRGFKDKDYVVKK